MPPAAQLDVGPLVQLFRALGDETRLRIVALLAHGELCVCHVEDALGLSQPNASRQLGILRSAGVVESRRQGSWVYYRLLPQQSPERERHLQLLVGDFASRDQARKDVVRLKQVRGPDACT